MEIVGSRGPRQDTLSQPAKRTFCWWAVPERLQVTFFAVLGENFQFLELDLLSSGLVQDQG